MAKQVKQNQTEARAQQLTSVGMALLVVGIALTSVNAGHRSTFAIVTGIVVLVAACVLLGMAIGIRRKGPQ
jgi:uncharacterized membrane-anchored protein